MFQGLHLCSGYSHKKYCKEIKIGAHTFWLPIVVDDSDAPQ
jgi:hypothetical protein